MLAMHLRGDAFSAQAKARNFAYDEVLTVRDSSLSACTQAVIAAEVGHTELAYDYFAEASSTTPRTSSTTRADGLHIAALAAAWIVAVADLGGMRDHDGTLSFTPRLPERLTRLAFGLSSGGASGSRSPMALRATRCLQGPPLEIAHHGERITASTQQPVSRPITRRSPRASSQGSPPGAARRGARRAQGERDEPPRTGPGPSRRHSAMIVWSVGHSTHTLDGFVRVAATAHGIALVADIRAVPEAPSSSLVSFDALVESLLDHGVAYLHPSRLAGWRCVAAGSPNGAWRNPSFRGYADYAMGDESAAGRRNSASWRQRSPPR